MLVLAIVLALAPPPPAARLTTSCGSRAEARTKARPPNDEPVAACSLLLAEMPPAYGPNNPTPAYSSQMQRLGVARAVIVTGAEDQGGKATHIKILRRLYFNQCDGPGAEILDPSRLRAIERGPLPDLLDPIALDLARNRPVGWWRMDEHSPAPRYPDGTRLYAVVSFGGPVRLGGRLRPCEVPMALPAWEPAPPALALAARIGDLAGVIDSMRAGRPTREQLTEALFKADLDVYDNASVVEVLVRAGAEIEARLPGMLFGRPDVAISPLTYAVVSGNPCAVQALLDAGANGSATDSRGRSALQELSSNPMAPRAALEAAKQRLLSWQAAHPPAAR